MADLEAGVTSAGDALVTQYKLLCASVERMMAEKTIFKSLFQDINCTLVSLQLLFESVAKSDDVLDQLQPEELEEFRGQMEKGVKLIAKCFELPRWKVYRKYNYTNQLLELKESLGKLSNILDIQMSRDVKESLVSIKKIETYFRPKGLSVLLPEPPSFTVGLEEPLEALKEKLLSNDQVPLLVLTGFGGCGKTTLAAKFCHDQKVKDKFKDNIFFVAVSKDPKFEAIVQKLYQHKGTEVPTFPTQDIAVSGLQQLLKKAVEDPLLLVLDDVWPGSESLLDKFNIEAPNCKILVTSRSEFPNFGSAYHVKALNDEEAIKLFHHSASLGDKSSHIPEYLSRKVLQHCKGLPLAIVLVGRSLCARPIEIWRKRATEWSKGSSILETETGLLLCLQSSLDALEKETADLKKCFMDLASFPKEHRISVAALMDMWAELYDLVEETSCIGNIYELTSRNLANLIVPRNEEVQGDGYYSDHFVTQHDLLRELAVYQNKLDDLGQRERLILEIYGDNIPRWWKEKKFQPMEARLVSISTDKGFSVKLPYLQLPEAEVLVLNFETSNYALPEFVEKMDKLKVLAVTYYGSSPVELSNFELLEWAMDLKTIRLECISIGSITNKPVQFKSLQKLSIFMCAIGQAFSNSVITISDAFPNLEEMNIDHCDDLVGLPEELCDLIGLRRLSITYCHKLSALPEGIGKLASLEVLRLKSCTDLADFPVSFSKLKRLNVLDISDCLSLKKLHDDFGALINLRKINMKQCSRLEHLPESVIDLEQLEEVICDDGTQALWKPFLPKLHNLHLNM